MRNAFLLLLVLLLAVSVTADKFYNEEIVQALEDQTSGNEIIFWMVISVAVIGLVILYSIFFIDKMGPMQKKVSFVIIVGATILFTLFVVGTTIMKNLDSETGGPVHWHADFEIWMCGEKIAIEEPTGLDNKIGVNILHHHNDYRIHIEGTPKHLSDISVGNFFSVIGGHFDEDTIAVITNDGTLLEKNNGDLCNGQPGKVQFYVNGEPNTAFGDHVPAPYSTIPPGDFLQIVFDSKEGVPNGG